MKKFLLAISAAFLSYNTFGQWTAQTSGTSGGFTSVYFKNLTDGIAVNGLGEIFRYNGTTWTLQVSAGSSMYGVHFGSANNGIAVGAGGSAMTTTDGGSTWTGASTGQGYALTSVFMIDADTGYAVG